MDAAVACALVQTVVDPLMCGLAGFGSMHLYMPDRGTHVCIDFHGRAPKAARADMWEDLVIGQAEDGFGFQLEGRVNEVGYQSIMTPLTLKALDHALTTYGTRPLNELLAPAIAYAEEGFLLRPHVVEFMREAPSNGRIDHREYVTRYPGTRAVYCPDGALPEVGDTLVNADMARTLRRIAEDGASTFYTGSVADEIVADMAANGGLLAADDLAEAEALENAPLWGTYRGHPIATNPPPGGGIMLLMMLNILEEFDLAAMGHDTAAYIATVSEAMKIATIAKDAQVGDPRFVNVPVDELTSKSWAAEHAARIRAGEKAHVERLATGQPEARDTTQVTVVDRAGNVVSMTHSIGMPSGVVTPALGFMYNGCMGVFDPRPGRAGSLAPGKSRFTAMCPTIVFDGEEPMFVVGAPGGTFITMGVLQAILNAVDFGMSAQEAVGAPRFCTTSDTIDLTNRILRRTEAEHRAMGYPTRRSPLKPRLLGGPRRAPHRVRVGGRRRPRPRRHGDPRSLTGRGHGMTLAPC